MANIGNTATATVLIDSREAAYELEVLKKQTKELRTEMDKAFKSGDKEGWMKLKGDSDELGKSMKKLNSNVVDVTKVLKNLNGTNLNELVGAQKKITAELSKMTRGTEEYVQKSKQLQLVSNEVKKVKTEMSGLSSSGGGLSSLANGVNKYFALITAAAASFTGIVFGVKSAVDAFNVYEKKLDTLQSLTGLAGEELQWLADQASTL